MSHFKRAATAIVFACLSYAALMAPANAAAPSGTATDYGVPVSDAAAMRIIQLNADTKWVNVTNGETVLFKVGGKSFTWHFDTYRDGTSFDLNKVAPPDVMLNHVRAYVAPNPLYLG